jgi:Tol biopolymer transport system component
MSNLRMPFADWCFGVLLGTPVCAQVTQRVSVDSGGISGNGDSVFPSISADGRWVAFHSLAANLVAGDTNGSWDVFVRDRQSGTTERVSVDSGSVQGSDDSFFPSVSADGRFVAFHSPATNLVPGDTNGMWDVFVRDRQSGTTERVSVESGGAQGNDHSISPSISADGRYVAFVSFATDLVLGDTNFAHDIFVRDRQSGTTQRVSVDSSGAQGDSDSDFPSISPDSRYVVFRSNATNLVPGDTNGLIDIFVRDRQGGTTERVSVDSSGAESDGSSYSGVISANGRCVTFFSLATNLVTGDTNFAYDAFVRDRSGGTTERVSISSSGGQGDGPSYSNSISADGRYVAFSSSAANLVFADTNGTSDIFVRDRQLGTTVRMSVSSGGAQGSSNSYAPSMSAEGRFAAFYSEATDLVPWDTNGFSDIFVRDRLGGPAFTSLCDPGAGSVIPCPCSNPPSGPGRGCDNSAFTGGAILSASGGTYLSSDSLVFMTGGERPSALSVLTQWVGGSSTGSVYGMGVRCTSGTFKRLYTKGAVGGSITVPDFGVGDPTVSARSQALGSQILPGESRWYFIYYRDPTVLGGCPAAGTFNATQTGQATWSP